MSIVVRRLGLVDYQPAVESMVRFTDQRDENTADEIWLLQHPPVFTLGLNGDPAHVLAAGNIPVVKVDRGGQVTYHGPGQLVVYVLMDLRRPRLGVRVLVRRLEASVVAWLDTLGVEAYGKPAAPGVYVARPGGEAKIAALGLKVKNGCTYHGLAVNVAMDLAPFADIDPCGFPGLAVTQLADLGVARTVEAAGAELAPILARPLRKDPT